MFYHSESVYQKKDTKYLNQSTPQPTEVSQYKNNSCTLKPKPSLVLIENSTDFFFEFEFEFE